MWWDRSVRVGKTQDRSETASKNSQQELPVPQIQIINIRQQENGSNFILFNHKYKYLQESAASLDRKSFKL